MRGAGEPGAGYFGDAGVYLSRGTDRGNCKDIRPRLAAMNRGIWIVAAWLVAKHGAEAPIAVHLHIMSLRRSLADEKHIASWLRIDDAVPLGRLN